MSANPTATGNCLTILIIAWIGFAGPARAVDEIIRLGSSREIFVDHYLIDQLFGSASVHLHRPEPKEVVLTTDAPWEGNTSAYYTLFQDDDIYRMYYRGSHWDPTEKIATHPEFTCYAESTDGIHWKKPDLGLVEFNGSKKNNIMLEGLGTHCFAAFKDSNPGCNPEARYKGISRGRPIGEKGLYVFQSPDGIHWKLMQREPVIRDGAFDSQNLAFWDNHARLYREYHRTFVDGKRAIMTSTSRDYLNWTDPTLLTYQLDAPKEHLYTNAVQPYERAPHLLIGFPTRYLPAEGQRVEPTLMLSRDGMHFHRWLDPLIPETAPQDRSGNRSNYMAWGIVAIPGRPKHLSVYATEAYYTGPDSRLRRFEFRKDGFVSVRADASGGEMITKPFQFQGMNLRLNFATSDSGNLRVEMQDANGVPLAGFTESECEPQTGDRLDRKISWNSGANLQQLTGKSVRLRFVLTNADLYAFRFSRN